MLKLQKEWNERLAKIAKANKLYKKGSNKLYAKRAKVIAEGKKLIAKKWKLGGKKYLYMQKT